MTNARVILWGKEIAAVSWDPDEEIGIFQYVPEFIDSGIHVSPLMMPLQEGTFQFPALSRESFKRLPGLLADSLPDKFGNALINSWLAKQGRAPQSFNPVERLCYVGSRGMGALEFKPQISGLSIADQKVNVEALVQLANQVINERSSLKGTLSGNDDVEAIQDILRVGTSAGGARAKAILAWNEATGEFRSGQVAAEQGFTQWILKFDGVSNNRDKELADPMGYGLIEYAYYLMAVDAGIEMMPCRIHQEGGRSHFMTQRFDRTQDQKKLHMQSFAALNHFDFNRAGAHSYEQVMQTILLLDTPPRDREQQFRRAVFNVVARNQDDHVKNIALLMDKTGSWKLSPAFDVAYSYNPSGDWTCQHQMSINGKCDHFELEDFLVLAKSAGIKKRKAIEYIVHIEQAVSKWLTFAEKANVNKTDAQRIQHTLRIGFVN